MAQATLAVTLSDDVWIQQVSTAHPEATFHVITAVSGTESGFALVRITDPVVSAVLEEMDDHSQIVDLSLVQRSDEEATVHFETTMPLLLFSSRDSSMPIEHPVEIRGGEATIEATGSREQLSQFGLQYRIESLQERLHDNQLLSKRQQELVVATVDQGYYDTPRRCSLTELADHLGIASRRVSRRFTVRKR